MLLHFFEYRNAICVKSRNLANLPWPQHGEYKQGQKVVFVINIRWGAQLGLA
jgi:hypothetical protein